jgi:uncharacterized membrane protein
MATPQKVFADNTHFWILPLLLALLKFLFDVLPKPIFFVLFALALGSVVFYDRYRTKQEEIAAQELEKSADQFLDELNESEKVRQEKESQKKALKEKKKELRTKNQDQQRVPHWIPHSYLIGIFCRCSERFPPTTMRSERTETTKTMISMTPPP